MRQKLMEDDLTVCIESCDEHGLWIPRHSE